MRIAITASAALLLAGPGCGLLFYTPYRVAHKTPEQLRSVPNADLCASAGRTGAGPVLAEVERRQLLSPEDRVHIDLERVAVGMSRCALEIVMARRHWILEQSITTSAGDTRLTWARELRMKQKFYATVNPDEVVTEWAE